MSKIKIRYKQGTVGYSGSFLTQNFSESSPKGFLLWNTEDKSSRFYSLDNPYAFHTIHCKNYEDIINHLENNNYSKQSKLRFIVSSPLSPSQQEKIKIHTIEKYSLIESPIILSNEQSIIEIQEDIKDSSALYSSIEFQNDCLSKYIEQLGYGQEYIDECLKIHSNCYSSIKFPDYNSTHFSIDELSFSWFGKYGENNVIRFKNEFGIVGIFSPNGIGKSSIIEILSFMLFGEPIKDINQSEMISKRKKKCNGELLAILNNEKYRIQRELTRTKNGASGKLNFEKEQNGEWISLNEEDVTKTTKAIEKLFGTKDNILKSSIASQDNLFGILKAKQAERLKILYKFTGLQFFEEFLTIAKKESGDISKELEILQKTNNSQAYLILENRKKTTEQLLNEENNIYISSKDNIKTIDNQYIEIQKDIKEIDKAIDIVALQSELISLDKIITLNKNKLEQNNLTIENNNETVNKKAETLREKLNKKSYKDLESILLQIREVKEKGNEINKNVQEENNKITEVNSKISILQNKQKTIDRSIEILHKHDWFETNDNCKQCSFLLDAWNSKKEKTNIDEQINNNKNILNELKQSYEILKNTYEENKVLLNSYGYTEEDIHSIQTLANEFKDLKNVVEKLILENETIKKTIEHESLKYDNINKEINSHKDIVDILENNKELELNLKDLKIRKNESQKKMENAEKNIWKHKAEMAKIDGQLEGIQEKLVEIIGLENKLKYYKVYCDSINKDGIPLEIIKTLLPKLNNEINSILSQSQNWRVELTVNNKDDLEIQIIDYSGETEIRRPIESASGSECTIAAFTIRYTLLRLSNIPKANFFIIDEGFNSLDADNIMKVKNFLVHLKHYFNLIIIISHMEQLIDVVDKQWVITQDDGYSKIYV